MSVRTILIVEDHAILREGLRALLSGEPAIEIVGEAADGHEAIRRCRELVPHIVLMDLSMPNLNGTEAIHAIKRHDPDIKIIVLTVHRSEEYVRTALEAGADGYLLKDDTRHELLAAIHNISRDKPYLSPGICDKVISGYLDHAVTGSCDLLASQLTVREREVTKLIAEGRKNREIAAHLSVSLKTVEKHRANLMRKLDIHSVSALTLYAIENGLVSTEATSRPDRPARQHVRPGPGC
jgi:DNA-binding NarL/FixJ family response regulator